MSTLNNISFSIITVNYNNAVLLAEVLNKTIIALSNYKYEIIIVDNHSTDDSFIFLKRHFSGHSNIEIVITPRNGGFGFGCNFGARHAKTEILWFLNSDAWVDSINAFDDVLKNVLDPKIGIVGTSVSFNDLAPTPQGGGNMSFTFYVFSSLRFGALYRRFGFKLSKFTIALLSCISSDLKNYMDSFAHKNKLEPYQSRGVGGASFLVDSSKFDCLKGFDEKFFLYDEDADLCLRSVKSGFINIIDPRVNVLTYRSATTSKLKSKILKKIKYQSRMRLVSNHFTGLKRLLLKFLTYMTWRLL